LVETTWYLAFATGAIKRRAIDVKFLAKVALAQRSAFAAVSALRSTIDIPD
jgi:hypothetical protein